MIRYYVFKQVDKREQVNLKEWKDYEYPTWQQTNHLVTKKNNNNKM